MWLIAGLFAFALVERLLSSTADAADDRESIANGLAEEDEDSDTQNNNNHPSEKKLKKDQIKRKHSTPPSQLSLLNPFRGMSSKQVHNFLFTLLCQYLGRDNILLFFLGDWLLKSIS